MRRSILFFALASALFVCGCQRPSPGTPASPITSPSPASHSGAQAYGENSQIVKLAVLKDGSVSLVGHDDRRTWWARVDDEGKLIWQTEVDLGLGDSRPLPLPDGKQIDYINSLARGENRAHVFLLNGQGKALWEKIYAPNPDGPLEVLDGAILADGTLLLAGESSARGFFLKVDVSSGKVSSSSLVQSKAVQRVYRVAPLKDGGFVALLAGEDDPQSMVARFDSNGKALWARTLPGMFLAMGETFAASDEGIFVLRPGALDQKVVDEQTPALLSCLDLSGQLRWQKQLTPKIHRGVYDHLTLCPGGCLVMGDSLRAVMLATRFEASGNLVWSHSYPASSSMTYFSLAGAADEHSVYLVGDSRERAMLLRLDADGTLLNSAQPLEVDGPLGQEACEPLEIKTESLACTVKKGSTRLLPGTWRKSQ